MSICCAEAGFQPDGAAVTDQPFGAGMEIILVLGLGGDARQTKIIAQFRHKPGLILFQIIKYQLHGPSVVASK